MFQPTNSPVDVMASFARLGRDGSQGSLIYLEDASAMRQRAQQMKLASLGRLTASYLPTKFVTHWGRSVMPGSSSAKALSLWIPSNGSPR